MFEKTFIIAEAGANHNGDLKLAIELVYAAKESGADAVKFQDFNLKTLFSPEEYEKVLKIDSSWRKSVDTLSFKPEWHKIIHNQAEKAGIAYFSTPFSLESVDLMDQFVPYYKVASGDISFLPLLEKIGEKKKGVFISTGASFLNEIDRAVNILDKYGVPWICIMHCIMLYPAPENKLNLGFIKTLRKRYSTKIIGFSDHSKGIEVPRIAVALGARVIEKHFTIDNSLESADHKTSLNPDDFRSMVESIRQTEAAINGENRIITEEERKERVYARRGIYAKRFIRRGQIIKMKDITFLRPNTGIGADETDKVIGRKAKIDIYAGSPIDYSFIS